MATYYDIHTHWNTSIKLDTDVTIIHSLSKEEVLDGVESTLPNIFFSCGIHPWDISKGNINLDAIEAFISSNDKIIAIGECGLDKLIDTPMEHQMQLFESQIKLADSLKIPVIIHCVKAWAELIEVRKRCKPTTPWILHGFRGGKQQVEQLSKLGFNFSVGQFFNTEALTAISLDSLFLETDNNCINIREVYSLVSRSFSCKTIDLVRKIDQNVSQVFKFPL